MNTNKTSIIVLIIVMCIAVIGALLTSSLAIWTEIYEDEKTSTVPVGEFNPSFNEIIFAPLDSNGQIIGDATYAFSYAAVGYTGLVNILEIPSEFAPEGYPKQAVTAVLVDNNYISAAFQHNTIITKLILPHTISRIGSGVFAGLTNLEEVIVNELLIDGFPPEGDTPELLLEDYCFMGTTKLHTFLHPGHVLTFSNINGRESVFMDSYFA